MAVLGGSFIFDLLALISGFLLLIFTVLTYFRNKWTKRGIPFDNVHPIVGNIQDSIFRGKKLQNVIRDFYLKHKGKPFIAFFTFHQPAIMINDIDLVKTVLIKDFSSFADRNFTLSEADPLEHYGMFGAKGQYWKDLRTKLSPTFTSGKLKRMVQLIDDCGAELITCLKKNVGEDADIDVKDFFSRFTTDVIASVTFGIEGQALKNPQSEFRRMLNKAITFNFRENILAAASSLFPVLIDKLKIPLTKPDVLEYMRKTVWDTVEYRKKNKVSRNDFLNLMIQLREKGYLKDDDPLEEGEIVNKSKGTFDLDGDKFVAQCYLFLTAGFETSSQTMTHAMYEFSLNKELQTKAYEEINTVLSKHEGKITYDAVQEMEYLHMVMQETLRKYPVLHFLDRQVVQPYRLPGTSIELKPGDSVIIPVIGMHYDPEFYPDPERFDPERFNEEQKNTRPSCSFLGFGDGPRICIGMRLGYMQAKVGIIHTLMNFEISPSPTAPNPLKTKGSAPFNQIDGAVTLRLTKRRT